MLRRQPALDVDEDVDGKNSSTFCSPTEKSAHLSDLNNTNPSIKSAEAVLSNSKNSLNRIELVTKSECRRAEKVTDLTETDEGISRVLSYHETIIQKQIITYRDSSDVSDSESVSDENRSLGDENFDDKSVLEGASNIEHECNGNPMDEEEDDVALKNKDITDDNFTDQHEYCPDSVEYDENSYSVYMASASEPNIFPKKRQENNAQESSGFKQLFNVSDTSFYIQYTIISIFIVLFLAFVLGKSQKENSLQLPGRSKDAFLLALPALKTKFPNQSEHLWLSMAAALQMVDANEDQKVAVVLFSASEKAEPTAACIAKAVVKSISNSPDPEISIDFRLSNFNKPTLDNRINEILTNSNSIILRHIELLRFPTLLYKFCDAESALLDKKFFFLTLASSVSVDQCQTCVEDFLRKAWVPSGKVQNLEIIEPLFSRIANCVVFVEAEKNIAHC